VCLAKLIHTPVFITVDTQLCSEQTAHMSSLAQITYTHTVDTQNSVQDRQMAHRPVEHKDLTHKYIQ